MMPRATRSLLLVALAILGPSAVAGEPNQAAVGFDAGPEGWSLNGWDTVSPNGGNPGARLHWNNFVDTFGMSARNETSAAFLGDYTAKGEVTLGIDVQVDFIEFFGTPVSRDLVVILHDDDAFGGAPPASVWAHIGTLDGNGTPWRRYLATVTNVNSDTLPSGWNGAGDEDPVTFEPVLPAGRTWSNVLAGVDRIEFTTFVPGFFFGFTFFNLSVDNISITPAVPAWSDEGFALAGVSGNPQLAGFGTLVNGTPNTLSLTNAAPSAVAGLFVAASSNPVPFKGGMLAPVPFLPPVFASTSPTGTLLFGFTTPGGLPSGGEIWMQWGIVDAAAVQGVALSNAVKGLVP